MWEFHYSLFFILLKMLSHFFFSPQTVVKTSPTSVAKTDEPAVGTPVLTYESGQAGQSCDEICHEKSATCSMQGFYEVNSCSALQQKFPCSLCQPSIGPDQPAFVVADRYVFYVADLLMEPVV